MYVLLMLGFKSEFKNVKELVLPFVHRLGRYLSETNPTKHSFHRLKIFVFDLFSDFDRIRYLLLPTASTSQRDGTFSLHQRYVNGDANWQQDGLMTGITVSRLQDRRGLVYERFNNQVSTNSKSSCSAV